jgi:hypothetical protein
MEAIHPDHMRRNLTPGAGLLQPGSRTERTRVQRGGANLKRSGERCSGPPSGHPPTQPLPPTELSRRG